MNGEKAIRPDEFITLSQLIAGDNINIEIQGNKDIKISGIGGNNQMPDGVNMYLMRYDDTYGWQATPVIKVDDIQSNVGINIDPLTDIRLAVYGAGNSNIETLRLMGDSTAIRFLNTNTHYAIDLIDGSNSRKFYLAKDGTLKSIQLEGTGNRSLYADSNGIIKSGDTGSYPGILHKVIDLTYTQVRALYSSPQTLIAAPGTNKCIDVISCTYFLNYNTTAYDQFPHLYIAGGNQWNFYGNTGTQDYIESCYGTVSCQENDALLLKMTADCTTGNSPVRIDILYRIIDLS